MAQESKDKVAAVTGCNERIGEARAEALAEPGAKVVATGRDDERLIELVTAARQSRPPRGWLYHPTSPTITAARHDRPDRRSSDLAARSVGCRDCCPCARHDRDGSRVFVTSVESPWSRLGASATVMRSNRRGAALPPEGG